MFNVDGVKSTIPLKGAPSLTEPLAYDHFSQIISKGTDTWVQKINQSSYKDSIIANIWQKDLDKNHKAEWVQGRFKIRNLTVEQVAKYLTTKQDDGQYIELDIIEENEFEGWSIIYYRFSMGASLKTADRDGVVKCKEIPIDSNNIYVQCYSIKDSRCPINKKVERIHVLNHTLISAHPEQENIVILHNLSYQDIKLKKK